MTEKNSEVREQGIGGMPGARRRNVFALLPILVLVLTQITGGSLSHSRAAPLALPTYTSWRTYTSDRLGIAIRHPASWHVYTNTIRGRYPGLSPILLASFEIEFEAVGHDLAIPSNGAAVLVALEGNDRPPVQSLADYALANLVSPYYGLTGRTVNLGHTSAVEMAGERGRVYLIGRGPNVYSVFTFAGNDPQLAGVANDILAALSPQRDGPVPVPKGIRTLPGPSGPFVALSEGPPDLSHAWAGPSMKMPWDRSATYRHTGGPHNWTMRWDCYLAPVDDACGLDFGMAEGTEILSVAGGTVQWGYTPGAVGNYVIVDHGGGWSSRYLHLSQVDPTLGWNQTISQGRVLGRSGTAGTGPHLHLEIRYNGSTPAAWHGTSIDGYVSRMYVYAADHSRGWNYQGTLSRGPESTTVYVYCGAQTIKWTGSEGTIVAGDGQPVVSTNQRHTGEPTPTPTATATPHPTPTATPVLPPNVGIGKSVVAGDLAAQGPITFVLSIANTGGQVASHVVVTDIVPSEVLAPHFASTLVVTSTGAVPYVWDIEPLGAGEGGSITVTGSIGPGLSSTATFCNRATIWDPSDTTPANNAGAAILNPLQVYVPLSLRSVVADIPTPTATPPSCAEGVANGGFESVGHWEIPGPADGIYPAAYSSSTTHSGEHAMRIGILNPDDNVASWSSVRQLVTIPTDTSSAMLHFWLYSLTGDPPLPPVESTQGRAAQQTALLSDDLQMVRVLTEDGQILESLVRQRLNDPQWVAYDFDLAAHAGRTVKLYFAVVNNGQGGVTGMYLDDVSLQICTTTPPP